MFCPSDRQLGRREPRDEMSEQSRFRHCSIASDGVAEQLFLPPWVNSIDWITAGIEVLVKGAGQEIFPNPRISAHEPCRFGVVISGANIEDIINFQRRATAKCKARDGSGSITAVAIGRWRVGRTDVYLRTTASP